MAKIEVDYKKEKAITVLPKTPFFVVCKVTGELYFVQEMTVADYYRKIQISDGVCIDITSSALKRNYQVVDVHITAVDAK